MNPNVRAVLFWGLIGLSILLISFGDWVTGVEPVFTLIYLGPIGAAAWYRSRRAGIGVGVVSAALSTAVDINGFMNFSDLSPLLDGVAELAIFLAFAALFSFLRTQLLKERLQARVDLLTEVANRRGFLEALEREHARSRRKGQVLTLAYIDIDDFKKINDRWGHEAGDLVLVQTARVLRECARSTDIIGRLGGDEFAVLLSGAETKPVEVLSRYADALQSRIQIHDSLVTFSIGSVTFQMLPENAEAMIRRADQVMYSVKRTGKGTIFYDYCSDMAPFSSVGEYAEIVSTGRVTPTSTL